MKNTNRLKDTHYTVDEVAEIYRKKPATIRKWARERKLAARKFGGKSWLFYKSIIHSDLAEISALDYIDSSSRMERYSSFDLLSGTDRIDVKSSQLHETNSKFHWVFRIDVLNKKDKEAYCDYLFFLCTGKNRLQIERAYLIPLEDIWKIIGIRGKTVQVRINKYDKTYEKYRIHRLDIPTYARKHE